MIKIAGFGGGCHWCTEAVFSALKGVLAVRQGWLASEDDKTFFSEGVIVEYNDDIITLDVLTAVHLYTHSSTANHSMRTKYRSAVYVFLNEDIAVAKAAIKQLQKDFDRPLITKVVTYGDFKLNREDSLNYYFSDPERPFCKSYIDPKLQLLLKQFSDVTDADKLSHLNTVQINH
jgi:peptide-methionine (S)-S-oxide reductase